MKIYEETSLADFKFWSGAKDRTENLTIEDFETIERELECMYPDGIEDGELNDMFWFEFDTIAQMLGYEDEEDFDRKRDPDYEEDEEDEEDELSDEAFSNYADKWLQEVLVKYENELDFLARLLGFFDLSESYENCYPEDEDWQNGPQMADFILKSWANGDVDVVSCLFEEGDISNKIDNRIPSPEELREMAIEYYKNNNE